MGDTTHTHLPLPPTTGHFTPSTPSGLTPNTRSEAEAALTLNSAAQTDSAAPTTPLPTTREHNKELLSTAMTEGGGQGEPEGPGRRAGEVVWTSSSHYASAVNDQARKKKDSVSSDLSTTSNAEGEGNGDGIVGKTVGSPPSIDLGAAAEERVALGQGVVPLHSGVGTGQAEAVRKVRPSGLSLGKLGRQQSWSEQDMKHVYTGTLLGEVKGDAGYSSGNEGRAVGP